MNDTELHRQLEVINFYARQMRVLDALDIDAYVATFTEDGVVDHAHRGERIQGRPLMAAAAKSALPRYRDAVVRHWNDHYLVEPLDCDRIAVSYCSLVSRTNGAGSVSFEPTFFVEDVLRRVDGELLTESRTIFRDQPTASLAGPAPTMVGVR